MVRSARLRPVRLTTGRAPRRSEAR
jgi:hypothetical protein